MCGSKRKAGAPSRKRKELAADCSLDTGVAATFFCARCKRPFCESCVGLEDRKRVYCLACAAVEGTKKKSEDVETKGNSSKPLHGVLNYCLFLLAVTGIYIGVMANINQPVIALPPPLTEAQKEDLAKCKENIEALSMLVAEYQAIKHRDPEDIEDVIVLEKNKKLLIEPVEKHEYGLERYTGIGLVVSCPNPDAHHLYDLYARPGTPAVVVKEGD